MVGKLERVNLREVWANEAANFTTWLERHLDILAEHIGIDLSALEREKSVGSFSADIYAEGPNGDTVVIENQLEKTDHDHLGKLVTYLSNLEAKTAIWITSNPRSEHATAINWLNEITPLDVSFFMIKVEGRRVCRIKSSCKIGGLKSEDLWDQIQEDMIDRMMRLEGALREPLSKI